MKVIFDEHATKNERIAEAIEKFMGEVETLETKHQMPIVVYQDGCNDSYYIKCSLLAADAKKMCDLKAKLDVSSQDSYKANRDLLLENNTYLKMAADAVKGREFNDIIVEYTKDYNPQTPLKVWGGQHRISAISKAVNKSNRYHGFRIYFGLSKDQRTDLALVSNTNISVSNDTFDMLCPT